MSTKPKKKLPAPKPPENEGEDKNIDSTMSRRSWIFLRLANYRQVAHHEIKAQFPSAANQSISDDIDHLKALGLQIQKNKVGQQVFYTDRRASHVWEEEWRKQLNPTGKKAIAEFCMGMIGGFKTYEGTIKFHEEQDLSLATAADMRFCRSRSEILKALKNQGPAQQKADHIIKSLEHYWSQQARYVAMDAGTTNYQIAQLLRSLKIPTPGQNLMSLGVCTNSRMIFSELGPTKVDSKILMIGGEQVNFTDAVAGPYSEVFMRNAQGLSFGIAFLGCTMLEIESPKVSGYSTNASPEAALDLTLYSDSNEEAVLKGLIFSRAAIRVLSMDDQKFEFEKNRPSYAFASVNPKQLDMIVTNMPRPPKQDKKAETADSRKQMAEFKERQEKILWAVDQIRNRGVVVVLVEDRNDSPPDV